MIEASGRTTRWLRTVERTGGDGPVWAVLLAVWIFGRNLLEGVLERPHTLGFDGRDDLSTAMVFLHFPVFYLVVFAWTCLLLHALTRRPLAGVLRATSLAFGVILIAPVVDAVVSRGAGYDLSYLRGLGPFLWKFWNPGADVAEVSPGQRVEIVLACVLAAAYVIVGWRSRSGSRADEAGRTARFIPALPALLAGAGVYLLSALAGAWPVLLARSAFGHWERNHPAARSAYEHAFRMGGLIPDESRRHALVMLLLLLPAIVLLAARRDPGRFRIALRALPWSRLLFYAGLVPAGIWLGHLVCRASLPSPFPGPTDWAAFVVLTASMIAAFLAAASWNDLHDRDADRVNAPGRPVAAGVISLETAGRLALAFASAAFFLALCVAYPAALVVLAILLLSWAYSAPPLRLKRFPGIATATLASLAVLSMGAGFSLFTREAVFRAFPRGLALALLAGVTLGFTAKDLKDREGDRQTGTVTLATLLPQPWSRRVIAALVAVSFALAPVLLRLGTPFLALSLVFAAASALWTLRAPRPDTGLLLAFCAFAAVVMVLLGRDPSPLHAGAATQAAQDQSTLLAVEREVRELRYDEEAGRTADPATGETLGRRRSRCLEKLPGVIDDRTSHIEPVGFPETRERQLLAMARLLPPERTNLATAALVRRRPLRAEYYEARLHAQIRNGPVTRTFALCQQAVERNIDPERFLGNRVAAALAFGDTRDVAADLRRLRARGGDRARTRLLEGDYLLRMRRPGPALRAYAAAERLDPGNVDAWAGEGEACHALGRYAEAVAALSRAVHLRPGDPWYRNNLAVALRDSGRLQEARAGFEETVRLTPTFLPARVNLADIYEVEGMLSEAQHQREEAARLGGSSVLEDARRLDYATR